MKSLAVYPLTNTKGGSMRTTLFQHLDEVMVLGEWMTIREVVNKAKRMELKNDNQELFSDGSARTTFRTVN